MKNTMTKRLVLSLAASAAVLGMSACDHRESVLNAPPGQYEKTTSSTDANGTTTKTKNYTDVSVDQNGKKRAVVTSKTTKDPKGLFNKTTSQSGEVIEEK